MIKMAQVQYIKHLYETEDKSLREISRITGLSQQTVTKYAYMSDWNEYNLPNCDAARYPILGDYIPIIDEWLEGDTKEPRKQRHTVARIHRRLQDEHSFKGGYSSVKKYVRKRKYLMKISNTGFLPLASRACHAELDFGEFKYYDGLGNPCTGYALTLSFPHSNRGFTQAFPSQNQECLLEGLKRIFYHIGGVPIRIKTDNMSTAVAHIYTNGERKLTDGFARFMLHHRFESDFCNPAAGNEKGNVENKVGYTRRNFFVPVPTIKDFDSFNKELLSLCDKDGNRKHYLNDNTINELWTEEKKQLLTLPEHEFNVFRYETVRIDKYGFVTVDTNKYGITPELAGQSAQVKIYFDKVEIYYDHTLLKAYDRSYKRGDEVMDFTQYLTTLCRKPGAVPHTRFFNQLPKLWQRHLSETNGRERKTALLLLTEIVRDGNIELCDDIISMANEYGKSDSDSIRQCYYILTRPEHSPKPLKVFAPTINYNPTLDGYDSLTKGGE